MPRFILGSYCRKKKEIIPDYREVNKQKFIYELKYAKLSTGLKEKGII